MMNESQPDDSGPPSTPVKSPKSPAQRRHRAVNKGMTDEDIKNLEFRITNAIVDHPAPFMGCCFIAFLILTVIGFGVVGLKLSDTTMEDRDDIRTRRADAFTEMDKQITDQPNGLSNPDAPKQLLRTVYMNSYSFIYQGGPNVLTLEKLKFIREQEEIMLAHPEFRFNCPTTWLEEGASCPGADCPWYRTSWDVTNGSLIQDGSMIVCSPQMNSLTWIMWNLALAIPTNFSTPPYIRKVRCNAETEFDRCVNEGVLTYYTDLYDPSTTYSQKQQIYEKGGMEPTQKEIDAYTRNFARLRKNPDYSWMAQYFDKKFDDATLPISDPKRYYTASMRSAVKFGGPIEYTNPKDIHPPCQERLTQETCNGTASLGKGCAWTPYAGYNKSMLGCAYDQYDEVSNKLDSTINKDQATDFGNRFAGKFDTHYDDVSGPVDVLYLADGIMWKKFVGIIIRDSLLAIVSFMFVYLYIQIHTGSFFLATLGMLQVIMPFPLAYFVYSVVFQVKAFYGLSGLTLYIVLAIGADDIFVFMDNWVAANVRPRADNCTYMRGRMAHAWKVAGVAMFITSMTTMAAFISTMTSPLLEISLFGLFAALLVMFDYILVMTFFACAVVIYHRRYENTLGCCCCGNMGFGRWCNCCTCYKGTLTDEIPTTPDGYDESRARSIGCCESKLTEPRTFETLEEARSILGQDLDHTVPLMKVGKEVAKDEVMDTPVKAADKEDVLKDDGEFRQRYIAGMVLLVLGVVVYLIGFIMLQADHATGNTAYIKWGVVIIAGVLLFCASMNALRAAKDRKVELGVADSTDSFMTSVVAPFLSGTSGIGAKPMVRFIPMIILMGVFVFMTYRATKLHPTTKNEQWLPDWHPIQKYMDSSHNDFLVNDQEFAWKVQVIVGLNNDPIDRSGTDKYDADDHGVPVYSDYPEKQTDMASKEFQSFFLAMCDQTFEQSKKGRYLQRMLLGIDDQNCIMRGFKDWVEANNGTFPVEPSETVARLWDFTSEQHRMQAMNYKFKPHEVFYNKILYDFKNGNDQPPTGVKAIYLEFNTTLKEWGNPYENIVDWFDDWNWWLSEIDSGKQTWVVDIYPTNFEIKGKMCHTSQIWVWMHTQALLVAGAINNTLVSLGLATFIVCIACFNPLIAFFVLLELIGVVGYVLGLVELMGWELGMIESVSITILVGLSVDYVVHFAVHYNHVSVEMLEKFDKDHAKSEDNPEPSERQKRVYEVVSDMGPTVLGGAATSIGAALILLCTWIQFFYKFGIFFLVTILFSYIFSMLFFLPLMSLVGPQQEFLSFRPFLAKYLACLRTDKEAQEARDIEMTKRQEEEKEGEEKQDKKPEEAV